MNSDKSDTTIKAWLSTLLNRKKQLSEGEEITTWVCTETQPKSHDKVIAVNYIGTIFFPYIHNKDARFLFEADTRAMLQQKQNRKVYNETTQRFYCTRLLVYDTELRFLTSHITECSLKVQRHVKTRNPQNEYRVTLQEDKC